MKIESTKPFKLLLGLLFYTDKLSVFSQNSNFGLKISEIIPVSPEAKVITKLGDVPLSTYPLCGVKYDNGRHSKNFKLPSYIDTA